MVISGTPRPNVTAKDYMLEILRHPYIRDGQAIGQIIEYAGPAVEALSVDERATMTNMAAEVGAFTGIVAADEKTVDYLVAERGMDRARAEGLSGAGPDDVLMVGGSTLLPGVFPAFEERFGRDRVAPGDAVEVFVDAVEDAAEVYVDAPDLGWDRKDLAPTEDQSVIFGIINTSANVTTDQNAIYARATEEIMLNVPETALTFQLLFPPSIGASIGADGFSGMVLEPWGTRTRTVFEILPEVQGRLSRIPGFQIFATMPPALPGGTGSSTHSGS